MGRTRARWLGLHTGDASEPACSSCEGSTSGERRRRRAPEISQLTGSGLTSLMTGADDDDDVEEIDDESADEHHDKSAENISNLRKSAGLPELGEDALPSAAAPKMMPLSSCLRSPGSGSVKVASDQSQAAIWGCYFRGQGSFCSGPKMKAKKAEGIACFQSRGFHILPHSQSKWKPHCLKSGTSRML